MDILTALAEAAPAKSNRKCKESTWWRHRSGEVSRPGIVTMLVGGGTWSGLEVL